MFPSQMDEKLAPYITEEEYLTTVRKVSEGLQGVGRKARRRGGAAAGFGVGMFILCAIFGIFHKPSYSVCAAPDGECSAGTDASAGCCVWWCCDQDFSGTSFGTQCKRTDAPEEPDEKDCNCRYANGNKAEVCDVLHLDGEQELIPEENEWAGVLQTVSGIIGGLGLVAAFFGLIVLTCGIKDAVEPQFGLWRSKGLAVYYFQGSKHSRARIIVTPPAGAPTALVVGAVASRVFSVGVPPGAGPGTTMQVQSPEGLTIQVQVPEGAVPGSSFQVSY